MHTDPGKPTNSVKDRLRAMVTPISLPKRGWRILNIAILLFAFFSPWFSRCGTDFRDYMNLNDQKVHVVSGWQATNISMEIVIKGGSQNLIEVPNSLAFGALLIGFILPLVSSTVSLSIYGILSLVIASLPGSRHSYLWHAFALASLAICSVGFAICGLLYLLNKVVNSLLWGYWIMWLGLISSLLLELSPLIFEKLKRR